MTHVDLCSGIGGFSLGLSWVGFRTVAWSEVDPYASAVMRERFPGAIELGDLTKLRGDEPAMRATCWSAGFPCQPFSSANVTARRGDRHDAFLWPALVSLVRRGRPRWLVLENVDAIRRRRGLERVLWDLADAGYVGSWACLDAWDFGAPFKGRRVYVVATPYRDGQPDESQHEQVAWLPCLRPTVRPWPDPPQDLRVDDGAPARSHRLRCLGGSVVPQVVAWIGERIREIEVREGER